MAAGRRHGAPRRRIAAVARQLRSCRHPPTPSRCACANEEEEGSLPSVRVIGTGGTIAGEQSGDKAGTTGSYRAGARSVGSLVEHLPEAELQRSAVVSSEQFLNVASPAITPGHWLALSARINALFASAEPPAGVVVTHGTDRLEETAFWIYLTVASDRPVVICGAQRPATGLSPDGPLNLLSAIRVAAAPESVGKGALVVMDDRILSAREARKLYPRSGGFAAAEGMGLLGTVTSSGCQYFYAPVRRHGSCTDFAMDHLEVPVHIAAQINAAAQGREDKAKDGEGKEGAKEEGQRKQQEEEEEQEEDSGPLPQVELFFSYPGGRGPTLHEDTKGKAATSDAQMPCQQHLILHCTHPSKSASKIVVACRGGGGDNRLRAG